MICSVCAEHVDTAPCSACGADPLLADRYRLDAVLGYGARGVTYWAYDAVGETHVAIKALHLHAGRDAKADELARREGTVLRQLHHPQIPELIEVFELGVGRARTLYVVQEHKPGLTLEQELEVRRYTVRDVLEVVHGVLGVLDYLHTLSPPVVHRDIKPANIIRGPGGILHLVDFGSVADELPSRTFGGSTVAGTFGFMAPEQFRGDAFPASDIYGVGALAVALLTRRPPHHFLDWQGRLQWHTKVKVSPEVSTLLTSMLQPVPEVRPQSAAAAMAQIFRYPLDLGMPAALTDAAERDFFGAPEPLPAPSADVGRAHDLYQQIVGPRPDAPTAEEVREAAAQREDARALTPLLERMRQIRSKVVIDD